jgi:hypothetical protein
MSYYATPIPVPPPAPEWPKITTAKIQDNCITTAKLCTGPIVPHKSLLPTPALPQAPRKPPATEPDGFNWGANAKDAYKL